MADKAILFDATRCTACRGCQVACKQWNTNDEVIPQQQDGVKEVNTGSYENPADLSPQTWIKTTFREIERNGKVRFLFNRRSCMHCTDAACVKVCPNHSVYHNEDGAVSYDKDTCTGCGYCVACPFDVPRFTKNGLTGVFTKMDKCTLCTTPGLNRIAEGMEPACVKSCPTDALLFGDRDELVKLGRKRVDDLKVKGFTNAYFYGDKELGGLHVMYVLDEAPEVYGLPKDPKVPPAAIAWQDVIQPMGWAVGGLTLVGLGLNYIVAREAKITRELPGKKEE
ncbi:MAG: 4Fe-4S dicluster domain-containing protein [Chloroflexi bacterium]|nr:4Fe-4S dicluster domain-containing protein [Chloroflexota bacterium]